MATTHDLEKRTVKALKEDMEVVPDHPDLADEYERDPECAMVISQSGSEYEVDARNRTCDCMDHQARGSICKHIRRLAMVAGLKPVPDAPDVEIDDTFGQHY